MLNGHNIPQNEMNFNNEWEIPTLDTAVVIIDFSQKVFVYNV